jgi:hypothetical protein
MPGRRTEKAATGCLFRTGDGLVNQNYFCFAITMLENFL